MKKEKPFSSSVAANNNNSSSIKFTVQLGIEKGVFVPGKGCLHVLYVVAAGWSLCAGVYIKLLFYVGGGMEWNGMEWM